MKPLFRCGLLTAILMKPLPRYHMLNMTLPRSPASVLRNPLPQKGLRNYGRIISSLIAHQHRTQKASLTKLKKTAPMWKIIVTQKLWYIIRLVINQLHYRHMLFLDAFPRLYKRVCPSVHHTPVCIPEKSDISTKMEQNSTKKIKLPL